MSGEERYDEYLVLESLNSKGDVVMRWERKVRCPSFLDWVKAIHATYEQMHPGSLGSPWVRTVFAKELTE